MLTEGKIITDFPLYLLIEPTSICNLRCVMCFQTDKSFGAEKKFMGRIISVPSISSECHKHGQYMSLDLYSFDDDKEFVHEFF